MEKTMCLIEVGIVALVAWFVLTGCTSHTRYYSTDGTTATEFERTTTIGGGNGTGN
jgi:hypothetical protein